MPQSIPARLRAHYAVVTVDGHLPMTFRSAGKANKHFGFVLINANMRTNLIARSGGESMQVGDLTTPLRTRGKYTIQFKRRR